jgi:hypothetical protein
MRKDGQGGPKEMGHWQRWQRDMAMEQKGEKRVREGKESMMATKSLQARNQTLSHKLEK